MKKIKDHQITVLKTAKVKNTDRIIGLTTILDITFRDDSKISYQFDYEKYAQDYIDDLYKRTNSIKIVEKNLFD